MFLLTFGVVGAVPVEGRIRNLGLSIKNIKMLGLKRQIPFNW